MGSQGEYPGKNEWGEGVNNEGIRVLDFRRHEFPGLEEIFYLFIERKYFHAIIGIAAL